MATTPTLIDGASIAPAFAPFNIVNVEYKRVRGTGIPASILIPKDATPGPYAVSVRWHGGGFGTGHRLYPDWYASWTLALYTQRRTLAITPDYRLLPSARGRDILADGADLYAWLLAPGALAAHLPAGIEPDLSGLLVSGESAGGWLALQAAFALPAGVRARSVLVAAYPMVDLASAQFGAGAEKRLFGRAAQAVHRDPGTVDRVVAGLAEGEVVTERHGQEGLDFVMGLIQQGRFTGMFGREEELYLLERWDRVTEEESVGFPPTWIFHGCADSIVPVAGSEKLVAKLREKFPRLPLHVTFVEGEEHGFDQHDAKSGAPATLETEWVKAGVAFVNKYWPAASIA